MNWIILTPTMMDVLYQNPTSSISIHPAVFAAILAVVTAVISFLMGRLTSGEAQKKFDASVTTLNSSVIRLESTVDSMKELNVSFIKGCEERHSNLTTEINRLRDKVE